MTIYHRLKVWAIKGYRTVRYGFMFVKPRELNMIWLQPVNKRCDYCGIPYKCVTLEADYEVVATICGSCLSKAQHVLLEPAGVIEPVNMLRKDPRGVVLG